MRTATRTTKAILAEFDLSALANPTDASRTGGAFPVPMMRDPFALEGPTVTFEVPDGGFVEVLADRVGELERLAATAGWSRRVGQPLPSWVVRVDVLAPHWDEFSVIGALLDLVDAEG